MHETSPLGTVHLLLHFLLQPSSFGWTSFACASVELNVAITNSSSPPSDTRHRAESPSRQPIVSSSSQPPWRYPELSSPPPSSNSYSPRDSSSLASSHRCTLAIPPSTSSPSSPSSHELRELDRATAKPKLSSSPLPPSRRRHLLHRVQLSLPSSSPLTSLYRPRELPATANATANSSRSVVGQPFVAMPSSSSSCCHYCCPCRRPAAASSSTLLPPLTCRCCPLVSTTAGQNSPCLHFIADAL